MTFSSAAVKQSLHENFVCTLINTEGDPSAGASMGHAPKDQPGPCSRGSGQQNVQCLFLTPKGEILHAVSGFVGPNDLKDELDFALKLFQSTQPAPSKAKSLVVTAHTERLKQLGFSDRDIKAPTSSPFGAPSQFVGGPESLFSAARGPLDLSGDNFEAGKLNGIMGFQSRGTVLNDHKFVMKHPLLPWKDFQRQPQLLVGSGKSAFVSTGAGGPSGGKIGK